MVKGRRLLLFINQFYYLFLLISDIRTNMEKNLESSEHKTMGSIATTAPWIETATNNSTLIQEFVMYNFTMYLLMKLLQQ